MSRSYKKTPIIKDKNDKFYKKYFNKKVRKTTEIPNGNSYKKINESWDISDWAFIINLNNEYIRQERKEMSFLNGGSPWGFTKKQKKKYIKIGLKVLNLNNSFLNTLDKNIVLYIHIKSVYFYSF